LSGPEPASVRGDALLPLRFDGVGLRRGRATLLDGLTFRLDAGPITAILGPNGAGKTTVLRLAHGLIAPTSGRIEWRGGAVRARRQSALLFQHPVLLRRSASANVRYALALHGVPRTVRAERAQAALAAMGLEAFAGRPARELSGGEQQRLALARARSLRPTVLFLDEPAAALDPAAMRELETAILRLRDEGTKVVFTTHDLDQARRMADEVLLLHRGHLVERSAAAAFFSGPRTDEGRRFLERTLHS